MELIEFVRKDIKSFLSSNRELLFNERDFQMRLSLSLLASEHYDDVDLEFTDEAIRAIAQKAIEQKTGARGLRSILEKLMLDLMFEIPSDESIKKVIITKDCVELKGEPKVIKEKYKK